LQNTNCKLRIKTHSSGPAYQIDKPLRKNNKGNKKGGRSNTSTAFFY